jgi:hypothetical protein
MQRRAARHACANCGMTCDHPTSLLLQHHLYRQSIWPRTIRKTFPALVGQRHVLLLAINTLLMSPHTNDRRLCLKTVMVSSENIHTRTYSTT